MKLSEILATRKDLQTNISRVSDRIKRNLTVQEGEKPAEDPAELLKRYRGMETELYKTVARINHINEHTVIEGSTLTEMLARREYLRRVSDSYRSFASNSTVSKRSYSRSEIKEVSVLDAKTIQEQADSYAEELWHLDVKIQEANWTVTI